ncbi:MAG: ABC transporter permease [Actinobacteria bacterium]|nr:ABC transporter permease [Actinomycetota bacterium]
MYLMWRLSLNSGAVESGFHFNWEWANYKEAFTLYQEQFFRSFYYAGIATVVALVIAYPLAYGIIFYGGRYKTILLLLVLAPFLTTYLIRTLAWETILSDQSPAVHLLSAVGLAPGGHVLGTAGAVIAGITYNFLPFMVLPLFASLETIDKRYLEAARDLYASPRSAFWRVTVPLSTPGIVAGALLTFIPAVGDYINANFLGGPNNRMIGNVVQGLYLTERNYPMAAALSFILMVVITVAVAIYIRVAGSRALMGDDLSELG